MKAYKRLIALNLVLVMLLSLFPGNVFAAKSPEATAEPAENGSVTEPVSAEESSPILLEPLSGAEGTENAISLSPAEPVRFQQEADADFPVIRVQVEETGLYDLELQSPENTKYSVYYGTAPNIILYAGNEADDAAVQTFSGNEMGQGLSYYLLAGERYLFQPVVNDEYVYHHGAFDIAGEWTASLTASNVQALALDSGVHVDRSWKPAFFTLDISESATYLLSIEPDEGSFRVFRETEDDLEFMTSGSRETLACNAGDHLIVSVAVGSNSGGVTFKCSKMDGGTFGAEGDNLRWSFDGETGVLKISGTGSMGTLDTIPWADVGQLSSLIVEDGVTDIADGAFRGMSVNFITLADSVRQIGAEAFREVSGNRYLLVTVMLPSALERIGDYAFYQSCANNLQLPATVSEIGVGALASRRLFAIGLDENNSAYQMIDGALYTADGKTLVCCPSRRNAPLVLPETVETIQPEALSFCADLRTVCVPASVQSAGAFYSCSELRSVWYAGTEEQAGTVFDSAWKRSNITFRYGEYNAADAGAGSTTNALTYTPVTGGLYVAEIASRADPFAKLDYYTSTGNLQLYVSSDGTSIAPIRHESSDNSALYLFNGGTAYDLRFNKDVTLSAQRYPAQALTLGENAVANAGRYGVITAQEDGWYMFGAVDENQNALSVTASDGVSPSSNVIYLKQGGAAAVKIEQDSGAATLTVTRGDPEGSCGADASWHLDGNVLVISGTGAMNAYGYEGTDMSPWRSLTQIREIRVESGITSVGDYAFNQMPFVERVTLPDTLRQIGTDAFYNMDNLEEIAIPSGTESIGNYAFASCDSLHDVDLPDTVQQLGAGAFANDEYINLLHVPAALTDLGESAFSGTAVHQLSISENHNTFTVEDGILYDRAKQNVLLCQDDLAGTVTLPDSVKRICTNAFYSCDNLKEVVIPEGCETIEYWAFYECSALERVFVPKSVTGLSSSAFCDCAALTDLNYAGSKLDWIAAFGRVDYVRGVTVHFAQEITEPSASLGAHDTVIEPKAYYTAYFTAPESGLYTMAFPSSTVRARLYDQNGIPLEPFLFDDAEYDNPRSPYWFSLQEGEQVFVRFYNISDESKAMTWPIEKEEVPDAAEDSWIEENALGASDQVYRFVPETTGTYVVDIQSGYFTYVRIYDGHSVRIASTDGGSYFSTGIGAKLNAGEPYYICFRYSNTTSAPGTFEWGVFPKSAPNPVTLGENVCEVDGETLYPFTPEQSGKYTFYSTNSGEDTYLTLYDADHTQLAADDDSGNNLQFRLSAELEAGVTYYLGLRFYSNPTGTIYLVVEHKQEETLPDLSYEVRDGEVTITSATDLSGAYEIPGEIEGYPVTKIGAYAFCENPDLTKITFPNTVREIGADAFNGLAALEEVVFSEGLTDIGFEAFGSCESLKTLNLPEGLLHIGTAAFAGCTETRGALVIPDSVETIGENAFSNVCGAPAVLIGKNVQSIGLNAFSGLWRAKKITFTGMTPPTLSDSENAFGQLGRLERIFVPDAAYDAYVEAYSGHIPASAVIMRISEKTDFRIENGVLKSYYGDGGEVVIPDGVTEISGDDYVFSCNTAITKVTFSEGLRMIGAYAFEKCSGLKGTLELPDSLTQVEYAAFDGCTGLTGIRFPSGMTEIGQAAFHGCSGLTGELVIPDHVRTVAPQAFKGASGVTSLVLGKGTESVYSDSITGMTDVTEIKFQSKTPPIFKDPEYSQSEHYLADLPALEKVLVPAQALEAYQTAFGSYLPDGAELETYAPENPFYINLYGTLVWYLGEGGSVEIPDGVTDIGYSAFENCTELTAITIPASVTYINSTAFSGCTGLTDVYYTGTQEQWDEVYRLDGDEQDIFADMTVHINAAEEPVPDCLIYEIQNGEVTITGCKEDAEGEIVIPSAIEGSPVTSIAENAFENRTRLTSVTIPNSVTAIGTDAFYNCEALQTVVLPSGLTEIPNYCFYRCSSLQSIDIPATVTRIGWDAFEYCSALPGIRIPKSVTSIGGDAFNGCQSVTAFEVEAGNPSYCSVDGILFNADQTTLLDFPAARTGDYTIPDTVKTVGGGAFKFSALSSLVIPDSVTRVGGGAFAAMDVTSLVVGAGIWYGFTDESDWPFDELYSLETLTFRRASDLPYTWGAQEEANWQYLGDLFYKLEELESLKVVYVPAEAYSDYEDLLSGCLPSGASLRVIGDDSKFEIENGVLTSYIGTDSEVVIPDTVTSIGENAFYNHSEITKVVVPDTVTSIGDNAFYSCTGLTEITIPSSVKSIGDWAFYNCSALTSLALSEGLESVGNFAFFNCDALPEVTIPASVTTVGKGMFDSCDGLQKVVLTDGLTVIGAGAFNYCSSLTDVRIPASVTSIGNAAFSSCTALTAIQVSENNLAYSAIGGVLFNADQTQLVAFPAGRTGTYAVPESVTEILSDAFFECGLTDVTISQNVRTIGESAFSYSAALEQVTVPGNVETIEERAFAHCDALASATLQPGVKTIGEYAFSNSALQEITIPGSVTSIGERAMEQCKSLRKAVFEDGVTAVPDSMFHECTALEEVSLADSITVIERDVFEYCTALTTVNLPQHLQSVGEYAFYTGYDCTLFGGELVLPDSLTHMGVWALGNFSEVTSIDFGTGLQTLGGVPFYQADQVETVIFRTAALPEGAPEREYDEWSEDDEQDLTPYILQCIREMTALKTVYVPDASYDDYVAQLTPYLADGAQVKKLSEQQQTDPVPACLVYEIQDGEVSITDCDTDVEGELVIPAEIEGCPVTRIVGNGFTGCTKLTKLVLPETLRLIGEFAFYGTKSLTEITIPAAVETVCDAAFNNSGLTMIHVAPGNSAYIDLDGVLFTADGKTLVGFPSGRSGEYQLPDGVTAIAPYAFKESTALTKVILPESLETIGSGAFQKCYGLTSLEIPERVTVIPGSCFWASRNLKEITLPATLTTIEQSAFAYSGIERVVFAGTTRQWNAITIQNGNDDLKNAELVCLANRAPEQIVRVLAVADETSIQISWGIAAELDTTIYRIYRRAEGENDFTMIREITSRSTLSYVDRSVQPGVTYDYAVVGVSPDGVESEFSELSSAALIPDTAAPRILKLTPASGKTVGGSVTFAVTADDNVAVTSCMLFQSLDQGASWQQFGAFDGATGTAVLNTAGFADGALQIKVVARDAAGNESDPLIASYRTDNTGPEQVQGVAGESTSVTITLRWNDVADDDIAFFRVEQKQADGSYRTVRDVTDTLGLNLYDLEPGYTGTWRVVGYDRVGNRGIPSEDVTVTTQTDTTMPVITSIQPHSMRLKDSVSVQITAADEFAVGKIVLQTSPDNIAWTDVAEQTYDTAAKSRTMSYALDLTGYDEGLIYVRGIATDFAGNESDASSNAPFVQHLIDRTAPAVPQDVVVTALDGVVEISWTPGEEADLAGYVVCRSTDPAEAGAVVEANITDRNIFDRTVTAGETYYYTVAAVDEAGNQSAYSEPVSATALVDSEAPVIRGITPVSGKTVGPANLAIHVMATDNRALASLNAEYSLDGETYTALQSVNSAASSAVLDAFLPNTLLSHGDTIHVRTWAVDAAGNRSETTEAVYTVDFEVSAPSSVSAKDSGEAVTLSWTGDWSADLAGYRIYRSVNGGAFEQIGSLKAVENQTRYSFEDADLPVADSTYTYRVEAADQVGNNTGIESDPLAVVGRPHAPVPALEIDPSLEKGVQYLFDASGSTADSGIASYLIAFGDGSTSVEKKAVHAYQETGTYTVTLTVTDQNGVTSELTREIVVRERSAIGAVRVHVTDETGASVPGAAVYFDLGDPTQVIRTTDGSGCVTFTAEAGRHLIGSFIADNQWLPTQKNTIVTAGEQTELTLVMVKRPMIEGEFEVHRMTFDEIVAAGIDVNDPENQHIVEITFQITYKGAKRTVSVHSNSITGEIVDDDPIEIDDETKWIVYHIPNPDPFNGYWNHHAHDDPIPDGYPASPAVDAIAVLEVPTRASCLKDFFDVKLHIFNNAGSEYRMEDNRITLNVPNGLTLMNTIQSEPNATVYVPSIPGQSTKTIEWILRGDEEGDYNLSADYSGVLSQFNAPVSTRFETKEPIHVNGLSSMKIIGEFNTTIEYDTFYFNLSLQNVGDVDMYMPNIDVIGDTITSFYYKARKANTQEEDPEEKEISVRLLNTSVTNESGFSQNIGAGNTVTTLTPGMMLTKKYAAYQVTGYNNLMAFKEACYEVARGYGAQVEIRTTDMPLYSYQDALAKTDAIVSDSAKLKQYHETFDSNMRYFYIQESCSRDQDVLKVFAERMYTELQAFAKFKFTYTKDELRSLTRSLLIELLSSDAMQDNYEANLLQKRLDLFASVLGTAKGFLSDSQFEADSRKLESYLKSQGNVQKTLTKSDALFTEGDDSFAERLGYFLVSAGLSLEAQDYIINAYNNGAFTEHTRSSMESICGDISDVVGIVADSIEAWDKSEELMMDLLQIASVEEEAEWLIFNLHNHIPDEEPMDAELKAIEKDMDAIEKARKDEFLRQMGMIAGQEIGKAALKQGLKTLTNIFSGVGKGAQFSSVYTLIVAAFNAGDYIFDWSGKIEDTHMLRVETAFTFALSRAFRHPSQVTTEMQATNTLRGMKYLLKLYMIGERTFGEVAKRDPDGYLQWVNETLNAKYKSVDDYVSDILQQLQWNRDSFYSTQYRVLDIPDAPIVTLNYLTNTTNESFDASYEYSYDGVEWSTADGRIPFVPGQTARTLRVRVAETNKAPAGNTANLLIAGAPYLMGDFSVIHSGTAYQITGLPAGTYRYAFTNDNATAPALNRSFTVDASGSMVLEDAGDWTYLAISAAATASSPASRVLYLVPEEVEPPILITAQPQDYYGVPGNTAVFVIRAQGEGLTYQWYFSDDQGKTWTKSGSTGWNTNRLNPMLRANNAGRLFKCVITDAEGNVAETKTAVMALTFSEVTIVKQPENYVGNVNDSAVFHVEAEGENLTYLWYYRDSDDAAWAQSWATGYNTDTLTVTLLAYRDGRQFRCEVKSGGKNAVYTEPVTMSLAKAEVVIVNQPADVTAKAMTLNSFHVEAEGENLTYRWYVKQGADADWEPSFNDGYNTATLNVRLYEYRDGYQYKCEIQSGGTNAVFTEPATLRMIPKTAKITAQPENVCAEPSQTVTFSVGATGEELSYQWQYRKTVEDDWVNTGVTGNQTDTLTVVAIAGRNGYQFRCAVTDSSGAPTYTVPAELKIGTLPKILSQPQNYTGAAATTAVFSVEAEGEGLTYQWYYKDATGRWSPSGSADAKNPNFPVVAYSYRSGYQYRCAVTNAAGLTVYTDAVTLTVQ